MWRNSEMIEALRKLDDMVQYRSVPYPNSELRAYEIRLEAAKIRRKYIQITDICEDCGCSITDILELHHIKPVSLGGGNEMSNLRLLCPNCHKMMHLNSPLTRLDLFLRDNQDLADGIKCKKYSNGIVKYNFNGEDKTFELKSDGQYYLQNKEDKNYV